MKIISKDEFKLFVNDINMYSKYYYILDVNNKYISKFRRLSDDNFYYELNDKPFTTKDILSVFNKFPFMII